MKTSARTKLLAALIAGCLIVPPSMAFAGPEEAAEYYDQASQAYEQEDFAKAADLLERAYAEDPNLIYQYNRVLALQAMGEYEEALDVLDIYANPMKEDGRFDDIEEIRAQLEAAKKKEAEEAARAEADQPAPDQPTPDQPTQPGVDDPGASPAADMPHKEPNILAWSLVGVGAAGLATAGVFGSGVLIPEVYDRHVALNDGEDPAVVYREFGQDANAQLQDDKDTWSTHQTITWISLGVGVAAAVGGGALLLMEYTEGAPADIPRSADATQIRVSPYVGADGAGGVLRLSF